MNQSQDGWLNPKEYCLFSLVALTLKIMNDFKQATLLQTYSESVLQVNLAILAHYSQLLTSLSFINHSQEMDFTKLLILSLPICISGHWLLLSLCPMYSWLYVWYSSIPQELSASGTCSLMNLTNLYDHLLRSCFRCPCLLRLDGWLSRKEAFY